MPACGFGQAKLGQPNSAAETTVAHFGSVRTGEATLALPRSGPSKDQLFQLESEDKLRERMRREYLALGQKSVLFPQDAPVLAQGKSPRLPTTTAALEGTGLCVRGRYFEEEDAERYGLYCPLAQPLISTANFYFQTLCLPVNMILTPPWSPRRGGFPDQ